MAAEWPGYFITVMIGIVIIFSGLGGAAIANYMNAKVVAIWFLGVVFIGMLIMVVGRFLKRILIKHKKTLRNRGHLVITVNDFCDLLSLSYLDFEKPLT